MKNRLLPLLLVLNLAATFSCSALTENERLLVAQRKVDSSFEPKKIKERDDAIRATYAKVLAPNILARVHLSDCNDLEKDLLQRYQRASGDGERKKIEKELADLFLKCSHVATELREQQAAAERIAHENVLR